MKVSYTRPLSAITAVIIIDQAVKTWVHAHMYLGERIEFLGNKGMLLYTENNGMAFGWELGGQMGKLALTLFRIGAISAIGYGLWYLIKHKYHRGLIMNMALIFAGALGNIIDSTVYGMIYGYAPVFQGRVIDMFYFPLLKGIFPLWIPIWGGQDFEFFRPIFNVADCSISIGVIMILLYQKRYFKHQEAELNSPNSEVLEE